MTFIRLIPTASILAGMTCAALAYSSAARAQTPRVCVVANNGKSACGPIKTIERACVTTDTNSTVCGKFKSIGQEEAQASSPIQKSIAICSASTNR